MKATRAAMVQAAIISLATIWTAPVVASESRASRVFTAEMAQVILGGPLYAHSMPDPPDTTLGNTWVSQVSYYASDSPRVASVLIRHGRSTEQSAANFLQSKTIHRGVEVAGLGVSAYRTAQPPQLNVLRGLNWLIITVGTPTTSDPGGQEKLARMLIPKITF